MKKMILLIVSMFCLLAINAQDKMIKGKVIDAVSKTPLVGANVSFSGNTGTVTNENGEFRIECSGKILLSISFLGYYNYVKDAECESEIVIAMTPASTNLDEVEITATSNPNKSQLEHAASIVKLKETELKRSTGLYLDDAINTNVPGVLMERRAHSSGQQINIRGYGNGIGPRGINGNFDSQGVKMYLNGIPITDAEGITVMDDIDFGSLGNVEISKGPSGTLYGLAIAGVVNLQTQKAEKDKTTVSQDLMAGSYGLLRTTSRLSIGGKNSSLLINYGHQNFDGFMIHTASQKEFVNVMADFSLNEKQSFTTYIGYSDSYDQRNGELTDEQYDTLDYSGNPEYINNDAHSAVRTFRAGVGQTYRFNNAISNTTSFFGSSQVIDQSSGGGWTDKDPLNYGFRSVFDKQFKLSGRIMLTGITGIEMQKMNANTIGYGMGVDSTNLSGYNIITSIKSNQATTNSTYSYFTQWTLGLPKDFSITAGVGFSNMKIKLEDRLWGLSNNHPDNSKQKVYETSYKNLVSPNFAINKKINEVASVYASYTVAYKAPVSSNILISTTGKLNTDLKPEKGIQMEIGTKGSMFENRLFYTIAIFHTEFKDKFTVQTFQNPSNTVTLYSYIVNGGELKNNGLELLVKYNLIKSKDGFFKLLTPFANLTYSDFKYGNFTYEKVSKDMNNMDSTIVADYTGNTVAGVAPLVYNIGIDFETKIGLYGTVNYNYRSSMFYTSDGLNETDPFYLLNTKVGFNKSIKHFEFDAYVGANNMTSSQYYQMVFVNQLPDAFIPGPNEINFFGGLNIKYNF